MGTGVLEGPWSLCFPVTGAGLYSEEGRVGPEALGQPVLPSLCTRPPMSVGASVSQLNPQPSVREAKQKVVSLSVSPALVKLHLLVRRGVQFSPAGVQVIEKNQQKTLSYSYSSDLTL